MTEDTLSFHDIEAQLSCLGPLGSLQNITISLIDILNWNRFNSLNLTEQHAVHTHTCIYAHRPPGRINALQQHKNC